MILPRQLFPVSYVVYTYTAISFKFMETNILVSDRLYEGDQRDRPYLRFLNIAKVSLQESGKLLRNAHFNTQSYLEMLI